MTVLYIRRWDGWKKVSIIKLGSEIKPNFEIEEIKILPDGYLI